MSLTRARRHLLLVGHARFLSEAGGPVWSAIVRRATRLPGLQELAALLQHNQQ